MADSWWGNFVEYVAGPASSAPQNRPRPAEPAPPSRYASAPAPIRAERAKIASGISKRQAEIQARLNAEADAERERGRGQREAAAAELAATSIAKAQSALPGAPVDASKNPKVEWLKDNILPGQLPGDKAHVAGGGGGMEAVRTGEIAKDDD